jgi:predicted SprT family Zn-dependent metalloprotease
MTTARAKRPAAPAPPPQIEQPIVHGDQATIQRWLSHYWQKLNLPEAELRLLAITQDRAEYMLWTGKRLNPMTLGCYCYIPPASLSMARLRREPELVSLMIHRHLIFIEPTMRPQSIEVTIAHELIHLADRVNGTPRRHHHHGYDSIAADEAAITGYCLEELRTLLHEESSRREQARRAIRPIRYLYQCPNCGKSYPRTRKYSQSVSCSSCDRSYNPRFKLQLISNI